MGQLPLENGKPKPADERFSLRSGFDMRTGSQVRLEWLWFKQVLDGVPALGEVAQRPALCRAELPCRTARTRGR